jgi:hypothetical protein
MNLHDLSKVEDFAALSWRLDNPFVNRAELLADRGLDEAGWSRIVDGWITRLTAEDGAALVEQFSRAYRADYTAQTGAESGPPRAAAREELLTPSAAPPPSEPPALVSVASIARPALHEDAETLLPYVSAVRAPALPFQAGPASMALVRGGARAPAQGSEGETLLPEHGCRLRPATPFAVPPAGADGHADTLLPEEAAQILSFEAYAALRAALMDEPGNHPEILSRFGVADVGELHRIQEHWKVRFAEDPVLRDRWLSLLALHRR